MNQQDREHFDGLIVKAVQAGKQETSGLVADIKTKFHLLDDKIDGYIKDDTKWKKEAQPVIDMGMNIAGFSKVTKIIVGIGAAIGSIWYGFTWISTHIIK